MQPQAVAASPGASAAAAAAATAAGGPAMAAAPAGVGTRHLGGLWRTSVRQEAACNTYVASISSRYLLEAVPPHERQGGEVGVDAQGWTKWSFPGLSLELAVEIADEAAIWCTMQHELEAGVDPADAARAAADILLEGQLCRPADTYVRSGALAQLQGLGVYKLWRRLMDTKQRQLLTTSYFARAAGLGGGEAAAAVPAAGRLEEPAVQQQVAAGGAVQQENGEQPLQQHAAAAAVKQEAVVKQEEGEQQQQQQQQQRQRRRLRQDEYGVVHVSGSLTDRERRRWLCRMPPPSHWQPSEGSLDMGLFHDKAAAQHAFRACMAWQELTGQRAEGIVLSAEARALVEGEAYEALIADEELAERLGDLGADGASDLRLDLPSIVEQLMGSVSAAQPKHGRKRARGSDSGGARPSTRQRRLVAARAAPEAAQPAAESAEAAAAPPEAAPAAAPGAALEAAQQTAPVVPFREVPAAAGEEPSPKAAPPAPPMQPAGKVGAGATAGAASMAAEGSGAAAAAAVLTQRPAGPNTPAKSSEVPGEAVQQQLQQAAATATAATAAVVQQPRPDAAEGTGQEMPPLHLQQQQQQQQQQPIIPTAAPAAAPAAAPPAAALEDQLAAVLRSSGVGEEGIDAFRSNCHRAEGSAGGVAAFLARFLLPACQAPPAAPLATAPAQNSWMARVAAAAAAAAVAAVMAGAAPAAV